MTPREVTNLGHSVHQRLKFQAKSTNQDARAFLIRYATERLLIVATFARRKTPVPEGVPLALTPVFSGHPEKRIQWGTFVRKANLPAMDLSEVVDELRTFLTPAISSAVDPSMPLGVWPPGGPWGEGETRVREGAGLELAYSG